MTETALELRGLRQELDIVLQELAATSDKAHRQRLRQYADECVREFQRIVQQQAQNRRSAERRGEGGERGAGEGVGA